MSQKESPAGNSGLAKGGLTCFAETFVQARTFVLLMNFRADNPALRQAENRKTPCEIQFCLPVYIALKITTAQFAQVLKILLLQTLFNN